MLLAAVSASSATRAEGQMWLADVARRSASLVRERMILADVSSSYATRAGGRMQLADAATSSAS